LLADAALEHVPCSVGLHEVQDSIPVSHLRICCGAQERSAMLGLEAGDTLGVSLLLNPRTNLIQLGVDGRYFCVEGSFDYSLLVTQVDESLDDRINCQDRLVRHCRLLSVLLRLHQPCG